MKLVFPVGAMILATASCCCCGDLFNTIMDKAGIDNPMGGGAAGYGDVPSDLSELPSYPGAEFFAGGSYGGTSTANWYVDGATPAQVVKYYRSNLKSDGWSIDSSIDIDEISTLQASRSGKSLTVSAMTDDGRVMVSVSLD